MTHAIALPVTSTAAASISPGHRVALFRWQGHAVSIGASPELIDTLSELMGLEYEAGAIAPGWHLRAEEGHLSWPAQGREFPCPNFGDLLTTAATVLPSLLMSNADCYGVHGSAFVIGASSGELRPNCADGKAYLFLGPRYAGKTTIAMEAWMAGYPVIGDDTLLVNLETRKIQATPRPMKIRRGFGLAARLESIVSASGRVFGEPVSIVGRGVHGVTSLSEDFAIDRVFLVERSTDRVTRIEPVRKYDAIAAIASQRLVTSRPGLGLVSALMGRIAERRIFRLRAGHGDPAGALAAVLEGAYL